MEPGPADRQVRRCPQGLDDQYAWDRSHRFSPRQEVPPKRHTGVNLLPGSRMAQDLEKLLPKGAGVIKGTPIICKRTRNAEKQEADKIPLPVALAADLHKRLNALAQGQENEAVVLAKLVVLTDKRYKITLEPNGCTWITRAGDRAGTVNDDAAWQQIIGRLVGDVWDAVPGKPRCIITKNQVDLPDNFDTKGQELRDVSTYKNVSPDAKRFIAGWEGCRYEGGLHVPYDDDGAPGGNCTVGYGHYLHEGRCGTKEASRKFADGISHEKAVEFLDKDIDDAIDILKKLIRTARVTQSMFDALVSLVFNGVTNSTYRVFNFTTAGRYPDAAKEFLDITKAGDVSLEGLRQRRIAERDMYLFNRYNIKQDARCTAPPV